MASDRARDPNRVIDINKVRAKKELRVHNTKSPNAVYDYEHDKILNDSDGTVYDPERPYPRPYR
mgnify:CR=1 FL=1